MKFLHLILVFLLYSNSSFSQNSPQNNFSTIDKKVLKIPKSMTQSTDLIASYIKSHFKSDQDKSRAVFVWVATNISYEIDYLYDVTENRDKKILRSLKSRKGICENYAALFTEICNKVGLQSYVIEGYTKQNSNISTQSHAWSAALVDGVWYLYDPTWSAGFVKNGKFIKKMNDDFFQQHPEDYLASHMPFDYLWQFSNSPISNQDFCSEKINITSNIKKFDFQKALKIHQQQTYEEKLKSSAERVEDNGVQNNLIRKQLTYLKTAIDHAHQNKVVNLYNAAAAHYNEALTALNNFIEIRNKSSRQTASDHSLKNMVAKAEVDISTASEILNSLPTANPKTTLAANRLRRSVISVNVDVQKQKQWLKNYLREDKNGRRDRFNKRTASVLSTRKRS